MSHFVSLKDKNGQKLVLNAEEILKLTPVDNDWLQGTVLHLRSGDEIHMEPMAGKTLRESLINI